MVELNSYRGNFSGNILLNYYADGFIDLGYITLFAAAFPLGPVVAMISNLIEIWSKIYVFLYVYKRPQSHRGTGIGEWMAVWEFMSLSSVFTNFALLYLHHTGNFNQFIN